MDDRILVRVSKAEESIKDVVSWLCCYGNISNDKKKNLQIDSEKFIETIHSSIWNPEQEKSQ